MTTTTTTAPSQKAHRALRWRQGFAHQNSPGFVELHMVLMALTPAGSHVVWSLQAL